MSVYVTYDVVGHEGKLLGSLKCPWMSPMMWGGHNGQLLGSLRCPRMSPMVWWDMRGSS